ncbi:zinc finger protein 701-like isoform X3 [Ambystoma mexicanum]|uniref:zinc finger protein 701-like isoform X3 n=1 Tax=Ambystoma mexicanum TaxID=8296 RepID=UPI0037E95075
MRAVCLRGARSIVYQELPRSPPRGVRASISLFGPYGVAGARLGEVQAAAAGEERGRDQVMAQTDVHQGAQATFHDASNYFSEEEWKLLQEWQKELYQNVMKEIHQALISLGPLIATTVFSLRAKEKQEVRPVNTQELDKRLCIAQSTKDETSPIFIDDLGEEVGESSSNASIGHEIISFRIKEEKETYSIDHQHSRRTESGRSPTGDRSTYRQKKAAAFIQSSKTATAAKTPTRKINARVPPSYHKATNSRSQLLTQSYWDRNQEKSFKSESGFNNSEQFSMNQRRPKVGIPPKNFDHESSAKNSQLLQGHPNTEQNPTSYTISECDTGYRLKSVPVRHTGVHSRERPYACTDCEKVFFHKANLIKHYRTHTGEKPCKCAFCHKSFSRKDNLTRHIRMHTGEKPYNCADCGKSFTWKDSFNQHRRKHNGEDPFHGQTTTK